MINSVDLVNSSDDDSVVEVETMEVSSDTQYKKKRRRAVIPETETIVIDDGLSQGSTQSENNNVIDLGNYESSNFNTSLFDFDNIYKENKLMAEFIEKCLDIENSEGMLRVIEKTLLRIYKETDKTYVTSESFKKVLMKALSSLEIDPKRKFSHVKNLCEVLKRHKFKKRANLITLETNLKDNRNFKRNDKFGGKINNREKSNQVIDLDNEHTDIINLDDDVIDIDEPMDVDEEKENKNENSREENQLVPQVEITLEPINNTNVNINDQDISISLHTSNEELSKINDQESNATEQNFLMPQVEVYMDFKNTNVNVNSTVDMTYEVPITYEPPAPDVDIEKKVKEIEEQIAWHKNYLVKLEEAEVDNDSKASPYIQSENVKAQIVTLYNTLCELTGHVPVKKRNVRLQVREGHPPGPTKRLEEFINSKICKNGDPPFPDFCDVIRCVLEANESEGLGWGKTQVTREARSLFVQCGHALQKRRQRREWRDLMSLVKMESLDDDPADRDPELLAKLEENRRIALRKEDDLLQRYAMLQDQPLQFKNKSPIVQYDNEARDDQGVDIELSINTTINNENQNPYLGISETIENKTDTGIKNNGINSQLSSETSNKIDIGTGTESPKNMTVCKVDGNSGRYTSTNQHVFFVVDGDSNNIEYENATNGTKMNDNNNLEITVPGSAKDSEITSKNIYDVAELCNQNETQNKQAKTNVNNSPEINTNKQDAVSVMSPTTVIDEVNTKICSKYESMKPVGNSRNISKDMNDKPTQVNETSVVENLNIPPVKVKAEPIDIAILLEQLGDNFTSDIIDIEDPFLVIEISDSSDDDT